MGNRTLPLTARKASVLETTMAALELSPDPAGTDPVTRMSTGTGLPGVKYSFRTP